MRFFLLFLTCICFLTAGRLGAQTGFPEDWTGNWQGILTIFSATGQKQEVPMQLHIQPIDTSERYTWLIIYGPDEPANRRSYELITLDEEQGHYRIDEKNTIELEAYWLGEKFYSRFEVMGNWLLTTYERRGEELLFEVISGSEDAVRATGGGILEEEEIPVVRSFAISVAQRAVLRRSP